MRKSLCRTLSALIILAAVGTPAWAADETYPIKLSRPDKAGDLFDIDFTIDATRTATALVPQRDSQIQTEVIKGQLLARVEFLEVDKKGDPISIVMTIKKLVDGDGKEMLKSGQELKITRAPKSVAISLVSGEAVPQDAEKLIQQLYGPHNSDAPDDDETFGSPDKHKVGDSWPINAEVAAKGLASTGLDIDAKQITGTTTVKAADTVNGVPVLRMDCQVLVKDATPAPPDPTMKVDGLNMQVDMSGLFPVDTALQSSEASEKMTMELHMTSTTSPASVTVKGLGSKIIKITPVKK